MRTDYGLYIVAIICFIIAGIFVADRVPGYTLQEAYGATVTITVIFTLIGIISLVVGYSARPKAAMPTPKPTPTLAAPPEEAPLTPPPAEMPPSPPPIQPPAEEVAPETLPPEQLPPPQPSPPEITPTAEPEQLPKVAEEEKPKKKPVRRRRKKAQ